MMIDDTGRTVSVLTGEITDTNKYLWGSERMNKKLDVSLYHITRTWHDTFLNKISEKKIFLQIYRDNNYKFN